MLGIAPRGGMRDHAVVCTDVSKHVRVHVRDGTDSVRLARRRALLPRQSTRRTRAVRSALPTPEMRRSVSERDSTTDGCKGWEFMMGSS